MLSKLKEKNITFTEEKHYAVQYFAKCTLDSQ